MAKLDQIEAILKSELTDYNIISSKNSNKQSLYLTFLNEERSQYCQLRISTHNSKSSFYSNKTFVFFRQSPESLIEEIKNHLRDVTWASFGYSEYFALQIIKTNFRDIKFYIDNTFGIFFENIQGMVLYYETRLSKNRFINMPSEALTKIFRKLFATGLISYYELNNDMLEIYISDAGFALMGYYESLFFDRFQVDFEKVNWKNISLPDEQNENEDVTQFE